jgi:hypothetical protein
VFWGHVAPDFLTFRSKSGGSEKQMLKKRIGHSFYTKYNNDDLNFCTTSCLMSDEAG